MRKPDAQLEMRMLAILPSAFTEAHYDAGYLSAIDPAAEFSLAQGLGRPMSGRCFRVGQPDNNLDPGPPTGSAALSHGKIIVLPTGRPSPHRARLPHRVVVSAMEVHLSACLPRSSNRDPAAVNGQYRALHEAGRVAGEIGDRGSDLFR